jgi:hypothetical protein
MSGRRQLRIPSVLAAPLTESLFILHLIALHVHVLIPQLDVMRTVREALASPQDRIVPERIREPVVVLLGTPVDRDRVEAMTR